MFPEDPASGVGGLRLVPNDVDTLVRICAHALLEDLDLALGVGGEAVKEFVFILYDSK